MTLSSSQVCRGRMPSIRLSPLIPVFTFIIGAYMLFGRLALIKGIAFEYGDDLATHSS